MNGTSSQSEGSSLRRIARNSSIGIATVAANTVCSLVVLVVLARSLGTEGLGQYFSVFVATTIVQLVLEAGISTLVTRRLAQAPDQIDETLAEAGGLFVGVGLASWVAMIGVGAVWSTGRGDAAIFPVFLLASVACVAMQVQWFAVGVFRGIERFGFEGIAKTLQGVVFAASVLPAMWFATSRLEAAVATWAASHVAAAVYLIVMLRRLRPFPGIRFSGSIARKWLFAAVPLGLGDILRRLTLQIDHLLLAVLQPPAMLGIYSVAIRPLGPITMVPRAIVQATFPYLSRAGLDDREGFQRAFATTVRLLWILSLPVAALIFVLAEPIVLLLAGPKFLDAVLPMRILVAVIVLSYPTVQFRFALTALGHQRQFTLLALFGLVVEAVIEAVLITRYGYLGACIGFVIGEIGFLIVGLIVCGRLGVGRIEPVLLARALPAAALMVLGLWSLSDAPLVWQLAASVGWVGGYFLLCGRFGAIRQDESAILLAAVARRLSGHARLPAGDDKTADPPRDAARQRPPEPPAAVASHSKGGNHGRPL